MTNNIRLNRVIGYPLLHTQSPLLHQVVYQTLKIEAALLPYSQPKLFQVVEVMKQLNVELIAVTMPFKEAIMTYLQQGDAAVQSLQAVNTIINRHGKFVGYNTDVVGIAHALRDTELAEKPVLIIGAGGAAKAVGYFLQQKKAAIFWLNRTENKAVHLAARFGGRVVDENKLMTLPLEMIINTTPLGMYPNFQAMPLPHYAFTAQQIIFDLIYHPQETALLKKATLAGAKTISGMEMFIGQGLKQIELWLELEAGSLLNAVDMQANIKKMLVNAQQQTRICHQAER